MSEEEDTEEETSPTTKHSRRNEGDHGEILSRTNDDNHDGTHRRRNERSPGPLSLYILIMKSR